MEPFAGVPPHDQRLLLQLGRNWNLDINSHRREVIRIYSDLLKGVPAEEISTFRDIHYAAHERQRLDIIGGNEVGRPVVMFYHGGAFTRGSKRISGEIYENLPIWFVRKGFLGINVEYRLAPEVNYPEGALDVACSVEWVVRNISRYGGDPSKIILIGHSAGGSHVATYLCDPNTGIAKNEGVSAAVLLSARLVPDLHPENPNAANVRAYFGEDVSRYSERSPLTYAERTSVPLFIAIAEYENRFLDSYGAMFFAKVAESGGRTPHFMQLSGHNHTSMVAHFDTGEERLGRAILDFLESELSIKPLERGP